MKIKTTIELNEETLKELLTSYFQEKTKKKIKKVSINIGTQSVGYYTSEHDEAVFENITIDFEEEV